MYNIWTTRIKCSSVKQKNDQDELELFPNKIECEVEFLLIAIKYLGRSDKLTTIIEFSVVCVHPSLQYLTYLGSASPKSLSAWICRLVSHLSNACQIPISIFFILVLDSCGVKLSSDGERPCQGKQLSFSQLSYNFKPVKQEQYSIFDNFLSWHKERIMAMARFYRDILHE